MLRKRSPFAQQLSEARAEGTLERRLSRQKSPILEKKVHAREKPTVPAMARPSMGSRTHSQARSLQEKSVRQATGSRQHMDAMKHMDDIKRVKSAGAVAEKPAGSARPGMGSRTHSQARSLQEKSVRQATGSRQHSQASTDRVKRTPVASRAHSPSGGTPVRTPGVRTPAALSRRGSLAEEDDSE